MPERPAAFCLKRSPALFRATFFGWSAGIAALDQASKILAERTLDYGDPVRLLSILDLRLQYNPGAAFSFLSSAGGWQRWLFIVLSTAISIVLVVWLWRQARQQQLLMPAALAMVLGGAIGNLIDRVRLGYVIDFISLHWRDYYYPTFNVADSAITVGGILLIWQIWKEGQTQQKAQ